MAQSNTSTETVSRGLNVVLVSYILLCLVGIISSWHLVEVFRQTHLAPDEHDSFCNISESMNCDKVALHDEFSVFLGTPVAIWAIAGYLFVAVLAALALLRARLRFGQGFLLLFGVLFVVVSVWLLYAMHFIIGSWCIVCLAIDVVNFSLFGLSIAAIRISQTRVTQAIRTDFRSLLTMPIQTAGLVVVGPGLLAAAWFSGQELQQSIAQGRAERQALQHTDSAADSSRVVYVSGKDERLDEHNWSRKTKDTPMDQACSDKDREALSPPVSIQVGISAAGYHWKGAAEPVLEIHEFTDFECPHCRNAHMMVSRLVSSYPDQIRVYHRHLPLDHHCNPQLDRPFHPRACELSRIAVCAGRQGRFFEMVDYLFHNAQQIRAQSIAATDIARSLALDLGKFDCCMTDAQTRQPIDTDLQEAAKLNLRGTPAFVIDGRAYYGKIPEEALKKLGAAAH